MENTDHNGKYQCPDDDPLYVSHTMAVRDAYQTYHLTHQGQLVASHPSNEVEGEMVVHTYDKNMFCLMHLQVVFICIWKIIKEEQSTDFIV